MKRFVVGIDPGVETGFALYSRADKALLTVSTVTFWDAYAAVTAYSPDSVLVVVERPNSRRIMYARLEGEGGPRRRERMAGNVGSNRREAELLIEGLERQGYEVRAVAPVKARKWDAEQFKRYTGFEGRTSQHGRDAARLCFGL